MAKSPNKRKKRSKLAITLLLPITAVMFFVGWSLFCIGQKQPKAKQPQKPLNITPAEKEELELIFISDKEEQILAR